VRAQPEDGQATSKKQSRPVTPCLPLLRRDEPAGGQAQRRAPYLGRPGSTPHTTMDEVTTDET
jgi:hypothetical protein